MAHLLNQGLLKPWENLSTFRLKAMISNWFFNSPSIDWACSGDDSDESNNEYCGYSSHEKSELKKCRKITQSAWEGVAFQKPNKLPHDIDGLCCFKLKDTNRIRLL